MPKVSKDYFEEEFIDTKDIEFMENTYLKQVKIFKKVTKEDKNKKKVPLFKSKRKEKEKGKFNTFSAEE